MSSNSRPLLGDALMLPAPPLPVDFWSEGDCEGEWCHTPKIRCGTHECLASARDRALAFFCAVFSCHCCWVRVGGGDKNDSDEN